MNSLFNTALKQSTSLKRDLSLSTPPTPSLLGQITASLTSFTRTLGQYTQLARTEPNPSKKEKAEERIASFRADLTSFQHQLKELKLQSETATASSNRQELLGRRPHNTATPENPYSDANIQASSSSQWKRDGGGGMGSGDATREGYALRENSALSNASSQLDDYLARGQAVLDNLASDRDIMKGTQRRLYSVANTLGVSGDTIRMVERRAKQDRWIFGVGVVVFFGFCWGVLHFLR